MKRFLFLVKAIFAEKVFFAYSKGMEVEMFGADDPFVRKVYGSIGNHFRKSKK